MKINSVRGDLSDVLAQTKSLESVPEDLVLDADKGLVLLVQAFRS